jgi:Uma2 family endonuclease
MSAEELCALTAAAARVDRWLFAGELAERWNGIEFHSPGHAATVAKVCAILGHWCRETSDFRVLGADCPFRLTRDPDTVITLDASVVSRAIWEKTEPDAPFIDGAPVLAVEVVELDEDPVLLQRMVDALISVGTAAVWVIDPVDELVVVHRHGVPPLYVNGGMGLPGGALPGFRCSVAEIFE